MYYASWALRGAEERYPLMEKLSFALVTTAYKLKSYFQAHTVIFLTDKPLGRAMSNPEVAGRLALWVIKLSEFDIQYRPHTTIKGQVITNFIAKFMNEEGQGADDHPRWSIHTEKSSNKQASIVLRSPKGDKIECMVHKCEALVAGLDLAKAVEVTSLVIYCDF